ncbi:MAG: stage III sporulation protein AF [Patescibacteria group bacterium]
MDFLASWLRRLVGTAIALGFLELVLPEGELRRFARVVLGLLVVLILMQPLGAVLRLDFDPGRFLRPAYNGPAPASPVQAGARVTAAGLAALHEASREELSRAVEEYCRILGARVAGVEVGRGADGGARLRILVEGAADPGRIGRAIARDFALPLAAIEVKRVG